MIRQANLEDYDAINLIRKKVELDMGKLTNSKYRLMVQRKGFLLSSFYDSQKYTQDLSKIYLIKEERKSIQGFIRIDEKPELQHENAVYWLKPELKEVYFSLPHSDIGAIAVSPEKTKRGIASTLLKEASVKIRQKGIAYLFSFVVMSPITNCPSLMFHEKYGFERVAISIPHSLFGLDNYQSILYGKKL